HGSPRRSRAFAPVLRDVAKRGPIYVDDDLPRGTLAVSSPAPIIAVCKDRYRARQTPAESRGIFLVPITMVAIKAKSP
ncbi:MAG: hypothetical protein WBW11_02925, partial [Pseudolabrys sp.]